jgi:hypothetical protein
MAEATEANPEGFYEDVGVVELNERILTDIGLNDSWRPERWPSRAAVRTAGARYRDEMVSLVSSGVAGWKDPRFAITLEAWLPALPQSPRVVVCLRSPRAYADSVTRIYGLVKPVRAMREWARHYRRLLAIIKRHKLQATCVEYDALIEQPEETVGALSKFAGRELNAALVVPRLRRERGDVPHAYQPLYNEVASLSGTNHRPHHTAAQRRIVTPEPTPHYAQQAEAIDARLRAATLLWEDAVSMPSFPANERTSASSSAYNTELTELQNEANALVPPAHFARQHTRLIRRVNLHRMIAQLAASASSQGDPLTRDLTIQAWKTYRQ